MALILPLPILCRGVCWLGDPLTTKQHLTTTTNQSALILVALGVIFADSLREKVKDGHIQNQQLVSETIWRVWMTSSKLWITHLGILPTALLRNWQSFQTETNSYSASFTAHAARMATLKRKGGKIVLRQTGAEIVEPKNVGLLEAPLVLSGVIHNHIEALARFWGEEIKTRMSWGQVGTLYHMIIAAWIVWAAFDAVLAT